MTHELKTVNPYFDAIWQGIKTFEVRYNDRDFRVDDTLVLKEWDEKNKTYSGREVVCLVIYILDSLPEVIREGYVVMAIVRTSLYPIWKY